MTKVVKAYSLDPEVIKYIHEKAKEMDCSDSWALNHLLTQLALKDTLKTKKPQNKVEMENK